MEVSLKEPIVTVKTKLKPTQPIPTKYKWLEYGQERYVCNQKLFSL